MYAAYLSQIFFSINVYVKLGRLWNCNLCAHAFANANCNSLIPIYSIHLFINYNTITNHILTHVLGVVLQTRVSGGNRTHDPHANRLAHYTLDYQYLFSHFILIIIDFELQKQFTFTDFIMVLFIKIF